MFPIDTHVHFHESRLVEPTLDAAAANFRALGTGSGAALGALLLTETGGERVFERLRDEPRVGAWQIERTDEDQSLRLVAESGRLLVVCGRQIIAERGLEVLALGTDSVFPDRLGLLPTLERIRGAQALPVLPWGFGKWWGERGEKIRRLLQGEPTQALWLGDNGGRLDALGKPSLLREAEQLGFRTLPGTDPFPFGRDYRRVGSFGCLLDVALDERRPWQSIAAHLQKLESSPQAYGRCSGLIRFGANQAWIQVHSRRRKGA